MSASVVDAPLMDLLTRYKRRVAGSYRALTPAEIPTLVGPHTASRKIDGELWFLVARPDGPVLMNPAGRSLSGPLPVLEQSRGVPAGALIAGELHVDAGGARERVGDLSALLAGPATEWHRLCFTAFDLVRDAEASDQLGQSFEVRFAALQALLPGATNLRCVAPEPVDGPAALQALFSTVVEEGGAEGLVVRSGAGVVYKLKPTRDVDAVIIAYSENVAEPGTIRSILLGLMHDDGTIQLLGGCGNIGSADMRKALHGRLAPDVVPSQVRYASDSGALYRFVRPQLVVTVRVTELQGERSDGTVTTTPVLAFDDGGWTSRGVRPCPRPIHPVLDRVRDDKSVTIHDVRFAQVADRVPVSTVAAPSGPLPASEVLRREVWTKVTKGQTAVRKLVIWRTNKVEADASFPAYVVHWTDYSATRGTPLEREVRLAPTEALAMELGEAMIAENIKKGWAKVGE